MSLDKIASLLAAAVPKAHVNLLFEEDFNRFVLLSPIIQAYKKLTNYLKSLNI